MTITSNLVQRFQGQPDYTAAVAPTIDIGLGVPAYMGALLTTNNMVGANCSPNKNGLIGVRVEFPSADLSTHPFVCWMCDTQRFNWANNIDTIANRGCVIVFQDGSGEWAAWTMYASGSEIDGYVVNNTFGFFAHFHGVQINSVGWLLERSRNPDWSSGTPLDWSDVVAVEFHLNFSGGTDNYSMVFGRLATLDRPVITGSGEDWDSFFAWLASNIFTPNTPGYWLGANAVQRFDGLANEPAYLKQGFVIGDGSTATSFHLANFGIVLQARFEDQDDGFPTLGPFVLVTSPRKFTVNQSASDDVSLTDGNIRCPSNWGWEVIGDPAGAFSSTRVSWYRCSEFTLGHGAYVDNTFFQFSGPLTYNDTAATLTRCVLRDATAASLGLLITTDAGDHSGLDVTFRDNAGQDLTIDNATGGTYDLSGITVPAGYTLKIRNNHASAAVTVQVPAGTAYSTSTAGGAITVESPELTLSVTVLDSTGSPIQNARVFLETPANAVLLDALTDGSGVASTAYAGSTPQAFRGWVRKADAAPFYTTLTVQGSIGASGLEATYTMRQE